MCHVQALIELSKELGPQPRYVLAKALATRIDVSMKTALDYVLSAASEGHLKRTGFNFSNHG